MAQVRAARSGVVTHNGVPVTIREGEPFDASDPLVVEFRWMFDEPVEQATAAPGEKRSTTRRKSQ